MSVKMIQKTDQANNSITRIEEAYRKIKQMIFDQKLIPGQRLVNQDLGDKLNMSRTPIINALNRLVQDGFVAFESFRGFYVRPIDLKEVWDAFGVREALEVYTVEQAIKLSDDGDIQNWKINSVNTLIINPITTPAKNFCWILSFIFKSQP